MVDNIPVKSNAFLVINFINLKKIKVAKGLFNLIVAVKKDVSYEKSYCGL
jgi:hypothetical protein